MRKALVTGAGGFIGSHLVESLDKKGVEVRALVHYNSRGSYGNLDLLPDDTRRRIEIVLGDIQDLEFVRSAVSDVDTVFHLAALIGIPYSYVAPNQYVSVNVQGTMNVLQACRHHGTERIVHTSTSEVYGTAQYVPMNEAHPLQGQSPYSASKIGADKIAESFHLSFGLPVVTVRPFNTFGPRQSARAVIPTIASQALAGKKSIKLGALDPVRDLTYVEDTVAGFLAAAECDEAKGMVVNLGNGKGISVGDLAERILALCGSNASVVQDESRMRPEQSEVLELICDNGRAREMLQWSPQTSLDDGLSRVISFVAEHPDVFRPGLYSV